MRKKHLHKVNYEIHNSLLKNPEMSTEGAHSKLLPGICDAAMRHHVGKCELS